MQLTNSELVLGAAAIGVIGTVLGAVIGGVLAYRIARLSGQDQRRMEYQRRQDDRNVQLYQDLLVEADILAREQQQPIASADFPHKPTAAEQAGWKARADLFASPAVIQSWGTWVEVWAEWSTNSALSDPATHAERFPAYAIRRDQARDELIKQMRRELESWHD